jgi:NADH-quinone oxidoreductase subunit N
LAVVAVLFSLIGAFYYLRIVKLMYFDEPETDALILPQSDIKLLISANGLAVLAFGLFPQSLIALCAYAIQQSI